MNKFHLLKLPVVINKNIGSGINKSKIFDEYTFYDQFYKD